MPSAFEFAQQQFKDALGAAEAQKNRVDADLRNLKTRALVLKGIAVFGGLLITSGFLSAANQVIGFIISVAVAFDAFVSNHKLTMSRANASTAYRRLLELTASEHTDALQRTLSLATSDPLSFEAEMVPTLGELRKRLENVSTQIRDALDKADYDALQALAIETKPTP
jgi:hypothetical protein